MTCRIDTSLRLCIYIFTHNNVPFLWTYYFFRDIAGFSNVCLSPPPLLEWNFRFWPVSEVHAESYCVVSWSTRCVYLVLPERPKFLTCKYEIFTILQAATNTKKYMSYIQKCHQYVFFAACKQPILKIHLIYDYTYSML